MFVEEYSKDRYEKFVKNVPKIDIKFVHKIFLQTRLTYFCATV